MLMVHNNPASIEGGNFLVDSKFHEGLTFMASKLGRRIATVHPRWSGTSPIMNMVSMPLSELPYDVVLLDVDDKDRPTPASQDLLRQAVQEAGLVVGQSYSTGQMAREAGVPYIALVEYDLQTQIVAGTANLANPLRKAVRGLRIAYDYQTRQRADLRGALSVHCNGYPIYEAAAPLNDSRILYLDSRLSADAVISADQLEARLATLSGRPLRLLFSGRFTAMKGVLDVVKVAIACQRSNIEVELSLYGQGEDRSEIERLIGEAPQPQQISVHASVPFPDLLEIAKQHDLFVCCHVQSDPSCTYVESMGAGLPIVGYGNRMWGALQSHSQAGLVSDMGDIEGVVCSISTLADDHVKLRQLSRKARDFAAAHAFEAETAKRIASMQQAIASIG